MGISALAGAGIREAAALFRPVVVPAVPDATTILPGVYVLAEPVGDAPFAGMVCTNWRHAAGSPAMRCPHCGPGRA